MKTISRKSPAKRKHTLAHTLFGVKPTNIQAHKAKRFTPKKWLPPSNPPTTLFIKKQKYPSKGVFCLWWSKLNVS